MSNGGGKSFKELKLMSSIVDEIEIDELPENCYYISASSQYTNEGFKEKYPELDVISVMTVWVDERTVDDPSKLSNVTLAMSWYAEGKNHRVKDGHIMRDMGYKNEKLVIEVLDLFEFTKALGSEIILDSDRSIEIYDDYRE